MATIDDVRKWDTAALESIISTLKAKAESVQELTLQLGEVGRLPAWEGQAAQAARGSFAEVADDLTDAAAAVAAVRRLAIETQDCVQALKHVLIDIEYSAAAHQFVLVNTSGSSGPFVKDALPPGTEISAEEKAYRFSLQMELEHRCAELVRTATDVEHDCAAVLSVALAGKISDGGTTDVVAAAAAGYNQGGLSVVEPPSLPSSDTRTNAASSNGWWSTLTEPQRAAVLKDHPDWVGNRDGIPAVVRDEANRSQLSSEKAWLQKKARDLQDELDGNTFG
ncbi:MAG: hypothetical protein ACRCSF_02895, partial [Mycobacteriaceae bacterium]